MPRLIDADMLEPSEVYMNYGFTRIVYMDDIDEMPTVDAELVRHGHWGEEWFDHKLKIVCSVCECFADKWTDYCPNCGAKMDEEEE